MRISGTFGVVSKYILMSIFAIIWLMPIAWMIISTFKSQSEIFASSGSILGTFWSEKLTFENIVLLFKDPSRPFGRYMVNTLFIAVTVTFFGMFVNSMAAFAFAKLRFPLKKMIFVLYVSSLIIPYEVVMIPQYLLIRDLDWINTYQALIVPQIAWVFGIFLLVSFFAEIPREILDAARIDGSGWFKIFLRIALPSAVPALITLALITFLTQWDSFLWPLIVINDESRQVIQVVIASFSSIIYGSSWGRIFAAATVSSLPIIVIFLFLQRYYVQSITMSGVKG